MRFTALEVLVFVLFFLITSIRPDILSPDIGVT